MSLDDYAALHLDRILRTRAPLLTPRERQVAASWFSGLCREVIASNLQIGIGTLRTHLRAIYRGLDVGSRWEFTAVVARLVWDDREG